MLKKICLTAMIFWGVADASVVLSAKDLAIPNYDQGREIQIEDLMAKQLYPWFRSIADERLQGVPRADGKAVRLRAKAILKPQAKANLLILHGYDEEMEKYIELAWDFHQASYNVFLLDMRGFGFSDRLEDRHSTVYIDRFDAYTDDIKGPVNDWIQEKAGGKPLFIFGHSTGAAVAIRVAQQAPDLVQALILSSPLIEVGTGPFSNAKAGHILAWAEALGLGPYLIPGQGKGADYWDFAKSDNTSRPRFDAFYTLMHRPEMQFPQLRGPSFRFVGEVSRTLAEMQTLVYQQSIATPILMFQAGQDTWVKAPWQEKFCRQVSLCQFEVVKEARHAIFVEPDSLRVPYLKKILDFISLQLTE